MWIILKKICVYLWIGFLIVPQSVMGENVKMMTRESQKIQWAGIPFDIIQSGKSNHHFIWIHGDEQTAKMALEDYMETHEGKALFIQNHEREIPFETTTVDPNRIFSHEGSKKALRKFKTNWTKKQFQNALSKLDEGRDDFFKELFPEEEGLLIALHNNSRGYNVYTEESKSTEVSIKKNQNPRDFILCTDLSDFEKLSAGPYNIVLQNRRLIEDDGSLSWASLERGVRYINIETRLGWLSQQKKCSPTLTPYY